MVDTLVPNNPYVGPRSIKTGEAFFGRDREIRSLSALLIAERIVLLHSPSGAGKSSLIEAGLVPRLAERFSVFPLVRVNLEVPEEVRGVAGLNRYVLSTLLSLEEGLPSEKRLPLAELAVLTLDSYLEQRTLPDESLENCLLLFDQFEEVLTVSPSNGPAKQQFFEQLGETLQNRRRWALFAIREDYMGGLAPYVRAIPNRLNVTFRLELLGLQAAKLAIQQPARDKSVDFADEAAQKLVDDLRRIQVQQPDGSFISEQGPDVEPVQLQVVCFNLWQSRAADDKIIDENDLQRVGSVDQALASYYANSVRSVAESARVDERLLRQWFDEHLITPDGIRSQVLKGSEVTEGLPNIVLRLLENAHLIRGETRAGKTWYELSHDRLVRPVRQDNTAWFEQNLSLLQRQSVLWNQQGRSEGLLLRGKVLDDAKRGVNSIQLTSDEHAFLNACRKLQAQQQFRRGVVIGLVSFSIMILGLLIFALIELNISRAQQLGFQAQVAFAEPDYNTAFLYAYQSNLIHKNDAADLVLGQIAYKNFAKERHIHGHTFFVSSLDWSADGQLASGSGDNTVIIWDLKTGQPIQTLKGHLAYVTSVAWSPDGQLASGSADGTVILWDLKTGRPNQILKENTVYAPVTSIAWSPDGRQLASGTLNGTVIVWDIKTGQPSQTLKGHTGNINSVDWSAVGQLASGSDDKTVIIWDLKTSQPAQTLKGHTGNVKSVAWSLNGQLASGSSDGIVIIWNLKTGKPAQTLQGHISYVGSQTSVAWSVDGQLASGSDIGNVIIWDTTTGQPAQILKGHNGIINSVSWSRDGKLTSGSGDGTIIIWDMKTDQSAQTLIGHIDRSNSVAWSNDGQLSTGSSDNTVIIWDLKTGQPAQTLKGQPDSVVSVAWSRDGRLASGSVDGTVIIWDLKTGQPAQTLKGNPGTGNVAWSADGQLASISGNNSIIIWDLKTGQSAQTLQVQTDNVISIAWSGDGRLASGSSNGQVIIWDLKTGQPAQTLKGHTYSAIAVAWSAHGQLASGSADDTVIIWDLKMGQPAQTLKGHTLYVSSLAWSADGQLASGSFDKTVIVWDIKTGQPAQTLKGNTSFVTDVAWSAGGQLASSSTDGTIKISRADLTGGTPCNKIVRNMTIQEWLDYQGLFFVYQPACSNLYDPTLDPALDKVILSMPITWKGRAILFVLLLVFLGVFFFTLWVFYKFFTWALHRVSRRKSVP